MSVPALQIRDLCVWYRIEGAERLAVSGVDLDLQPGRLVGLAGESGCGKSTVALSALGFRPPGVARRSGQVLLGELDLHALNVGDLRRVWGSRVAYLPQDAATSLTPSRRIGRQFEESLSRHRELRGEAARSAAVEGLESVLLPEARNALRRYPFEFSGGQQQRIALALALAAEPDVLVLDEPTTGLDVTTQATVVALIRRLVRDLGMAALYVSHDLPLVRDICDDVTIMYAGQIVESGPAAVLWDAPQHPYTAALLDAAPSVARDQILVGIAGAPPPAVVGDACAFAPRCAHVVPDCGAAAIPLTLNGEDRAVRCLRAGVLGDLRAPAPDRLREATTLRDTVLRAEDLRCYYGRTEVVHGVDVEVGAGEILAIVGESGSGKSTLLRALAGLHAGQSGLLLRHGDRPLEPAVRRRSLDDRRALQLVHQNPATSLNPRQPVERIVGRSVEAFFPGRSSRERAARVEELLDAVQLSRTTLRALPSQLSGGQQQRVALARALAAEPEVLLCDEVVSALDVSVQATVLSLIADLRQRTGVAVVFVTHDLAVVRSFAERVVVMRSGLVVESAATSALFAEPGTDYARELLAAAGRGG